MSNMADVLDAHVQSVRNQRCTCGWRPDHNNAEFPAPQHRDHLAAALSAAGFGPVDEVRAEFTIFRKRDSLDYAEPFDSALHSTKEQAIDYMRLTYKESAWKWLEVRSRTAPTKWTREDT